LSPAEKEATFTIKKVMKMVKKILHWVGTPVPECGIYQCDVCHELGIEEKEILKQGEYFPRCKSCDSSGVWERISSHN